MYASASNNTLPTLMLAHTWYEESIPQELYTLEKNNTLSLTYTKCINPYTPERPKVTNFCSNVTFHFFRWR